MERYNFKAIEKKWQKHWDDSKAFKAERDEREKFYILEMFPYPSGKLHMGHVRNYAIGDVLTRFRMAQGYNVLHPMGWDAFGLPAENAAMENNVHPEEWTHKNIAAMREQFKGLGMSFDWEREVASCDPSYYAHEQKIFLDFLKAGLAYQKESWVNWDPKEQTVLANEQVVNGKGWRSGVPVERKKLRQWFLKITDFADELNASLDDLEGWPEKVRIMQRNWIGRSEGVEISFDLVGQGGSIPVFTTRPDTLFGASFIAVAPNHPIAQQVSELNPEFADLCRSFEEEASKPQEEELEKRGFNTGVSVAHPFEPSKSLPVFVANYVLSEYGCGAVFGCPAHDERDNEFALQYGLDIPPVVRPSDSSESFDPTAYFAADGVLYNSQFLDGLCVADAKKAALEKLSEMGRAESKVTYRLRDWGVSRQRYWGCPIPIIYCNDCGVVPVPKVDLPVELPKNVSFESTGNPLYVHPTWRFVACPTCGKDAERETDTFDTFFESSWYFLRFCSPHSDQAFDKEAAEYWMPVDQYIGGIEHAILHLLYARFFTKALKHCGYVDIQEPFKNLLTQGMVNHATFQHQDGRWCFPSEVERQGEDYIHTQSGEKVTLGRSEKMSKSKRNVVDPDEIIARFGADTARLFVMSDSPIERDFEWSEEGVEGAWRFVNRLWRLGQEILSEVSSSGDPAKEEALNRLMHQTIKGVTGDFDRNHFNRAIARIRELVNALVADKQSISSGVMRQVYLTTIQLVAPYVPHLAEEIWALYGQSTTLIGAGWPVFDNELAQDKLVTVVVQVNGKFRGRIECKPDTGVDEVYPQAIEIEAVKRLLEEKEIRKKIYVPNKILNLVV